MHSKCKCPPFRTNRADKSNSNESPEAFPATKRSPPPRHVFKRAHPEPQTSNPTHCGGQCGYTNCTDTNATPLLTVEMYDSANDGWDGAYWQLNDTSKEITVESGTFTNGHCMVADICSAEEDACYDFSVTGGAYPSEISWKLRRYGTNDTLAKGGADDETVLCLTSPPSLSPTQSSLPTPLPTACE